MPFNNETKSFSRVWKFIDQFRPGDNADRADFDIAFDDLGGALQAILEYLEERIDTYLPGAGGEPTALVTEKFSGDESRLEYTLTTDPVTESAVLVFIGGIHQDPTSYTVSERTVTFSEAPPLGVDNVVMLVIRSLATLNVNAADVSTDIGLTVQARLGRTGWEYVSATAMEEDALSYTALTVNSRVRAGDDTFVVVDGSAGAGEYDRINQTGVKFKLVVEGQVVLNVRSFGATGDGVTDDTIAIQAAITATEAVGGVLVFPGGTYIYSDELLITQAITIRGSGRRHTIFKPAAGYSGWFMQIFESNFIGSTNEGPVVDMDDDTSGLFLGGFSVRSSRNLGIGPQHGIRCVGRNDRMRWDDIYIEALEGTHFHFGYMNAVTGNPAFIRECEFFSIESRAGGQPAGDFPSVVFDSHGPGDASNLCNFYGFRMVYPYHTGVKFVTNATGNGQRRLNFFGYLTHGSSGVGGVTTNPLTVMHGRCNFINFFGWMANGTIDEQDSFSLASFGGYNPTAIRVVGDTTSGTGGLFNIQAGDRIEIDCMGWSSSGTHVTVGAGITGPININTHGQPITTDIDASVAHRVNFQDADDENFPMRFARAIVGSAADSPEIRSGNGDPVAGGVQAPSGSIYQNKTGSGDRNCDNLWGKAGGATETGWYPVQMVLGGNTTQRPANPTLYQNFFDTSLGANGKPIWWNGSNWIDASSAIV